MKTTLEDVDRFHDEGFDVEVLETEILNSDGDHMVFIGMPVEQAQLLSVWWKGYKRRAKRITEPAAPVDSLVESFYNGAQWHKDTFGV